MKSPITYHEDIDQGSDAWLQARCGVLTASNIKLITTPKLKPASNDKEQTHMFELLAQRITGYVEPQYVSDAMLRGHEDEIHARAEYERAYAPVNTVGFITNTRHGFTLGYSPDGLVGEDGLIEVKSRSQKYQVETLLNNVPADTIPDDYLLQCQAALLISERQWIDFISYCGGLPMCTIRVWPDPKVQEAILDAAFMFEAKLAKRLNEYRDLLNSDTARLIPTVRRVEEEMVL